MKRGDRLFIVNPRNKTPIYEQLVDQLRQQIASGVLCADEMLPSMRQLSIELGINPNTIQKAYRQMEQEGLIYTVSGRGCFVTDDVAAFMQKQKKARLDALVREAARAREMGVTAEEIQAALRDVYKEEKPC